ncbi:MAG: VWA domain-containing protein [Methylococcales bacterium]|jgi:Ca-activated chloride channel homolog|nr:VWA domain-containing protein [Methylococcales bacterium]MBT7410332.1 VWA domain-containing protein [Methylococcales bacterium]
MKKQTIKILLISFISYCLTPNLVMAKQIKMQVAMSKPSLLANKKQTTFLKVDLTGFKLKSLSERTPTNIAIVLDKSGSMSGTKLNRAKAAAAKAINRLNSQDIVSIITYDNTVDTLVPATKVTDQQWIKKAIKTIRPGGSTALFAGVSKGAAETRKFIDNQKINRIILLSDGLANVGPQTPSELGELGKSLAKEGISVTTIGLGLGYNEDLMTKLAGKSGGNHTFAENASDLDNIFQNEFNDVLSVIAQEVTITIECAEGIRPIKILGRDANIYGQTVMVNLNQLYSNQDKYVLLEVEIPSHQANNKIKVASVNIKYNNMETHQTDKISSNAYVNFTPSQAVVEKDTDNEVMSSAIEQIVIEKNKEAVQLRDSGLIQEAKKVLRSNIGLLGRSATKYKSKKLRKLQAIQKEDESKVDDDSNWNRQRKSMRNQQYKWETQQAY